jgi:hypothetical protein
MASRISLILAILAGAAALVDEQVGAAEYA